MVIIYWVHFLVHILDKKHDFKTNHIQIKCVIFLLDQILKNGLVWTGYMVLGLYCQVYLSASKSYVQRTNNSASRSIWHVRLGYQLLQQISTKIQLTAFLNYFSNLNTNAVCAGCHTRNQKGFHSQNQLTSFRCT